MTYLWNHPNSGVPTQEARVQHPDFMAGAAGAAAVMAALLYRERTGKGQYIDEAQIEVGANLFGPYYLDYIVNGRNPTPAGNRRAGAAPHGAYPCVDGPERWCAISVKSQVEWERFCAAVGDPAWCHDPRFATPLMRERNVEELDQHVSEWTRQYTGQEVMARLQTAGVAAAPIQDVEDQFERDAIARERGLFIAVDEPEMGPVAAEFPPVRLSETPPRVEDPAPLFGEHTDEVLRTILGLNDETIESLRAEGVLD
jgi:crotonobetainyl-CoA:carnitine CoA-transferase CaiB-like acyl-CoA transferase